MVAVHSCMGNVVSYDILVGLNVVNVFKWGWWECWEGSPSLGVVSILHMSYRFRKIKILTRLFAVGVGRHC